MRRSHPRPRPRAGTILGAPLPPMVCRPCASFRFGNPIGPAFPGNAKAPLIDSVCPTPTRSRKRAGQGVSQTVPDHEPRTLPYGCPAVSSKLVTESFNCFNRVPTRAVACTPLAMNLLFPSRL